MAHNVLTVIYDGECGICEALKQQAQARDAHGCLRFVAYQTAELGALVPGLTASQAGRAVMVVRPDGGTWRGARAVIAALEHLPGIWGKIGAVGAIPAMSWLAGSAYRLVAARRGTISRCLGLIQCRVTPARRT